MEIWDIWWCYFDISLGHGNIAPFQCISWAKFSKFVKEQVYGWIWNSLFLLVDTKM